MSILMLILIFIFVFGAVLIYVYFLLVGVIPFFVSKYSQAQGRRAEQIAMELEESFIFWEKKKKIFLYLSPFIFACMGWFFSHNPLGAFIGFLLGFGFPNFMTKLAKRERLRRIQGQLVDSLMILSSSLKAGLSFIQAIEVLCEEMPLPISQEFNLVLKENRWGMSLEESLRRLRKRIPLEEMNLIVSSIMIARELGGDLPRVFTRLVDTIRNNIKLKEKIATLTLQGRLQGIIMMLLPIGFAYFVYRQNPEHFDVMWQSQLGRMLLIGAIVAQIVGMYFIKKISTIKI
jgi:tight adherence protein B